MTRDRKEERTLDTDKRDWKEKSPFQSPKNWKILGHQRKLLRGGIVGSSQRVLEDNPLSLLLGEITLERETEVQSAWKKGPGIFRFFGCLGRKGRWGEYLGLKGRGNSRATTFRRAPRGKVGVATENKSGCCVKKPS